MSRKAKPNESGLFASRQVELNHKLTDELALQLRIEPERCICGHEVCIPHERCRDDDSVLWVFVVPR